MTNITRRPVSRNYPKLESFPAWINGRISHCIPCDDQDPHTGDIADGVGYLFNGMKQGASPVPVASLIDILRHRIMHPRHRPVEADEVLREAKCRGFDVGERDGSPVVFVTVVVVDGDPLKAECFTDHQVTAAIKRARTAIKRARKKLRAR
jgi:hypothetical protein